MKKLNNFLKCLVNVLPVVLYFSYFPIISFGANETMNFELSLPMIWLVIFDFVALILMLQKKVLFKNIKLQWLLFPLWITLTVIWSRNLMRGVLTVGILWLIYFAGYGLWSLKNMFDERFRKTWWKWFFGATIAVCLWCFLQCVLDIFGISREYSLMCSGCTYTIFGFPHPNGFAAEPQFMGNLLLAPTIVAAWMIFNKKQTSKNYSGSSFLGFKFLLVCFFISAATIFLTLSRGAIFAFLITMVIMSCVLAWRNRKTLKRIGLIWLIIILSFFFTLNLQGVMAEASKTNDTYFSGVSKVINQLTLGKIDLGGSQAKKPEVGDETKMEQANFDGYVEVSTDARTNASAAALGAGFSSIPSALFGMGLGSASIVMFENGVFPTAKEIVNNEYATLFLETGLIGVSLLIYSLALMCRVLRKSRARVMMFCLILAYGISLCFFSGLANALHIYLLPVVIGMITFKQESF